MNFKKTGPFFIGFILIIWMVYLLFGDDNVFKIIASVNAQDILISLGISSVIFIINGIQLHYLIKRSSAVSMEIKDTLLLPASMNLWSYLLPFRGGLIYSAFYVKLKYGIELAQGFSIGIFTFMLSISLAGVFGLYLAFNQGYPISLFSLISLLLFASPFLLIVAKKVLGRFGQKKNKLIHKFLDFINRILDAFNTMFIDYKSTLFITVTILFSLVWYIFWVYWSARSFNFHFSMDAIIILALVLRLSVITRFIPGNVGIQELISGAATSLMGAGIQEGILIALFIRLTALIIAIILGVYSFLSNIDIFKTESFAGLWKQFKNY